MTDRPILFSAPMVRALLDGRKTQTRRAAKVKPGISLSDITEWVEEPNGFRRAVFKLDQIAEPRFAVGDRLWVREAHYLTDDGDYDQAVCAVDADEVKEHLAAVERLEASHPSADWSRHKRLRPGIHMPRWASRLTLMVTDVRVQRLHEISEQDAIDEGMWRYHDFWNYRDPSDVDEGDGYSTPRNAYRFLWEDLNADRGLGWEVNPWVVAVSFTVERRNIDEAA